MTCWPRAEDHCIQSLYVFHPARPHNPGHCIILTSILLHTILNPPAYYTQSSCILYSNLLHTILNFPAYYVLNLYYKLYSTHLPYFTNYMLNTAFYTYTVYNVHTAYYTSSHIHGSQTLLRTTNTDANMRL